MYEPRRLHPISIVDFLVRKLYSMIQALLPLIIIALAQENLRIWLITAIPFLIVLFVAYTVVYWMRYEFYVTDKELRLNYGVFIKKQRYIPFERIQTVHISAGILQNLLGLAKVQVETAGGGTKAEFVLSALTMAEAQDLRAIVQAGRVSEPTDDNSQVLEYQLSTRSLLLLATTSNGIGVAFSAILVVFSQLDEFFPSVNLWRVIASYTESLIAGTISMIILAVLAVFLAAWILSLVGTVIRYAGFRLIREGDNLKISRGLFEKHQITLPIKRIQAIKVVEGILRQPFGMMSIQVISLSNIGTKGEGSVLFPLLARSELNRFMEEIVPEYATPINIQSLPPRAKWRYLSVNTIPALIIAALVTAFVPWGYLAFIMVPLAILLGIAQFRASGWQIDGNKLLIRYRILGQVTAIIPHQRVQSMSVSQNLWQGYSKLTNLSVAVASNIAAAVIKVKGMDEVDSKMLVTWLVGIKTRRF